METYTLHIPSEDEIQFQVGLVDEPAIERDWEVFQKTNPHKFKELDKERRLLIGYAMIADKKIPRWDHKRGSYEVVFPRESVDKIVRNWAKNGLNKNFNEMHQTGKLLPGVYLLHHWQVDSELGIHPPDSLTKEADGSWVFVVKCDNDEIYQKALDGDIKGFSIEGRFIEEAFSMAQVDKLFSDLDKILTE